MYIYFTIKVLLFIHHTFFFVFVLLMLLNLAIKTYYFLPITIKVLEKNLIVVLPFLVVSDLLSYKTI